MAKEFKNLASFRKDVMSVLPSCYELAGVEQTALGFNAYLISRKEGRVTLSYNTMADAYFVHASFKPESLEAVSGRLERIFRM